jgi:hypothetical protein
MNTKVLLFMAASLVGVLGHVLGVDPTVAVCFGVALGTGWYVIERWSATRRPDGGPTP